MFKNYALINDGQVVNYPVDPRVWLPDENKFNIHEYWEGGELDGKTYAFCHNMEPPCAYDEALIETTPAFNPERGLWYRQYNIVKVDAETLIQRRQIAQKGIDDVLNRLFAELNDMAQTISELSESEQYKWAEYKKFLEELPNQSEYPFNYVLPTRPDEKQNLSIQVKRI